MWRRPHEILKGKRLHVGLVRSHPCNHLGVGGESIGLVVLELLLIYPVGLSVDDVVESSIGCDLDFLPRIEVDKKEVVFPHERNFLAVGRERRHFLFSPRREFSKRLVVSVVDIPLRRERPTVDRVVCGLEQYFVAVRRNDIISEIVDFLAVSVANRENRLDVVSRLVRAFQDCVVGIGNAGVVFPVVHGVESVDTVGIVSVENHRLERDLLSAGR